MSWTRISRWGEISMQTPNAMLTIGLQWAIRPINEQMTAGPTQ